MSFILALDQGTTSSRAIVFDRSGAIRGVDQREFAQHFPQPGWVEHDPDDIWRSQLETARGALRNAGIAASDLAAVGISNQRETTTLWDRATGRPVYPAIVWQDRRTAPMCENLKAQGYAQTVTQKTGLLLDPYFSATKFLWILDNVEGLRARAERGEIAFGTIDSWLIHNLTGGAVHGPITPMPRARCSSISTRWTGTTSCCRFSTSRARCFRMCALASAASARSIPACSAPRCRSRVLPGISRRR